MTDTIASEAARALAAQRKRETKNCEKCGKEFEGIRKAKYCSHECAMTAYWDAHRADLNKARRDRYQKQKVEAGA
jgi:hypothetical protein